MNRKAWWPWCVWLLPAMLTGCTYQKVLNDPWADIRQFEDKPRPSDGAFGDRTGSAGGAAGWSIFLQSFDGPDREKRANQLVDQLQRQAFVSDLWLRDADGVVSVFRGRYDLPNAPEAASALRQTRMIQLDGQRPFAAAELVAPGPGARGAASPMDLRQYVGYYSLQVAVYDEQIGPDFRKKAEQAAKALRDDGDEAYYYHGPNRSMVTVGLFTEDDFVQRENVMVYGPRVLEMQKKYPYNLVNGLTMIERHSGQSTGEQSSFLVRVN